MKSKGFVTITIVALLSVAAISVASFARGAGAYYAGQGGAGYGAGATSSTATACPGGMGFGAAGRTIWSEVLGISESDLQAARQSGKTIADLAKEKGISADDLVQKFVSARRAQLDQLVKQGRITTAQRDAMLETMERRVRDRLDDPAGPPAWRGQGNGACNGACGGR